MTQVLERCYHDEGYFMAHGGFRLFEQIWRAENQRGLVLIVHGYAEHSSRYHAAAAHFNNSGLSVYSFDLRGHGRSQGARSCIHSFDEYLDDLKIVFCRVRKRWGRAPLFLLGHSMGGLIAPLYLLREDPKLDGLILSAPLIQLGRDYPSVPDRIIFALGKFLPKFPTARLKTASLSHDPGVVEQYRNDAMVYHGRTPARTAAEMTRAIRVIRLEMKKIECPLMILHGDEDSITDIRGSRELFSCAGSPDKSLKVYDGLYHELLHEPGKERILDEISGWINKRLQSSSCQNNSLG
ncbi:MAG: lysophospholipase [Candidatus Eisenbacteria bacterium]|uniref:Monoacylglycerol lipase n=1 Tax=Eiseniibacteriota bacterium TaxID=2212470 RepID=A0A948S3B4_UNCEI|nr:lysophospholipase [Candidatus Eisenbacteria bacterium]MBU1949641.1 lysophospholipase [Candidatus Eisenbacteria bacterium]MBU2693034.1 lysophospholipase [Candidatus Eisenbacteria bacterium]